MRKSLVYALLVLAMLVLPCAASAQGPSAQATPLASHPVHFSGIAPANTYVRIYIQGPNDPSTVFRGVPPMQSDWSWTFDDVLVGEGQWKVNIDIKNASGVWLGHLEQFTLTTTATTEIHTLVLQQGVNGYAGTSDCYISDWVDGDETKAFGTLEPSTIRLRKVDRKSILIKFGLGPLPAAAQVQYSSFGIYAFFNSNPSGPTIKVYRMKRAWTEADATWLSPRPGQTWAGVGASGEGIDRTKVELFSRRADIIPGWTVFPVTSAVQAWRTGTPNYGLLMRSWDPFWASSAENSFYSSEWKQINQRPRITIYYALPS